MANSIEMASIDDQILRIPHIEKDEIEERSKVDHSINIYQIFAKKFKSCTMFKVKVGLRELNPNAYAPKMVSIGPYYKKNPQLHQMEKYKLLYIRRFLGRKEGVDEESWIKELEALKEEALKCYDDIETDEFVQMLWRDGCFVVEFIRECCGRCPEEDKIINDNIAGDIVRDLLLLENQLPFFILYKLHDMTKRDDELPLEILASIFSRPFFGEFLEPITKTSVEITGGDIKHLLHLKHVISCHGNHTKKLKDNDDQTWHMVMPNATELYDAGVSFVKVSSEISIFDSIKFKNGLMTIPRFRVTDDAETLLQNLIAYEQQSSDKQPKYFTDFVVFMNRLIESAKDVNLLRHKGIIENWLGEDKEVAYLFNKIGNGVRTSGRDFYYTEECRKAVEHCKKPWNQMRAVFLKNGLRQASTVAASIGLVLTIIQTILAFTGPLYK